MVAEKFAEKNSMSNPGGQLNDVVKDFLRVSRLYFGLETRSTGFPARLKRVRQSVLQSLLIVSSLGGVLGGTAHAESAGNDILVVRTGKALPNAAQSATQSDSQ